MNFWDQAEMAHYDMALHRILFQCCKAYHSMYLMNHQMDVDTYVVVITTASINCQSGNHNYSFILIVDSSHIMVCPSKSRIIPR